MADLNCFSIVLTLWLAFEAATTTQLLFLHNMCSSGIQDSHNFSVSTGIQLNYWTTFGNLDFIDCKVTLIFDRPTVGLLWRKLQLTSRLQMIPDCDRAFFEVTIQNRKPIKLCENLLNVNLSDQIIEFSNVPVTVRTFVNYSIPETPTTFLPTTDIANTTSSIQSYGTTMFPLYVEMILDFTIFTYCTTLAPHSFMCAKSRRCLDKSLLCDNLQNCVTPTVWGDFSDEIQCQVTEPPPTAEPVSLMPLWITLGVLAGCLVAYLCFFKPGYLPWRLARIRNVRCCGYYPCARCCIGGDSGGCSNCFGSRGHSVSPISKSGDVGSSVKIAKAQPGDGQSPKNVDKDINYQPTAAAPPSWMSIKYDDGNHLRELR